MVQSESTEKKKGFLDRLPKLGRVSQFILIVGVFLFIFVPMWIINQQQPAREAALNSTMASLQKILSVQEAPQAKFEAELAQANADQEAAKAAYPNANQAPEILDTLLALAQENDIDVTKTTVTSSTPDGSIGPVLAFTLGLKGQIPKFQNFLLALDTRLPSSQITQVTFTVAQEGQEYDTASVSINVLCYGSGN